MAIRAIKNEQSLAVRAVIEKWQGYFQNRKQSAYPQRPGDPPLVLRLSKPPKS
jgi:hypothetical protein